MGPQHAPVASWRVCRRTVHDASAAGGAAAGVGAGVLASRGGSHPDAGLLGLGMRGMGPARPAYRSPLVAIAAAGSTGVRDLARRIFPQPPHLGRTPIPAPF